MSMKLPPEWKEFYLRSLQVPVLGRFLLGPLLRGIWKVIQFATRSRTPPPQVSDGLLTTYASTVDSLRRQLGQLEQRTATLEADLQAARWEGAALRESARVQGLLLSAGVQSLLRRVEEQGAQAEFQRRVFSAALSGLHRRPRKDDAQRSRQAHQAGLCN